MHVSLKEIKTYVHSYPLHWLIMVTTIDFQHYPNNYFQIGNFVNSRLPMRKWSFRYLVEDVTNGKMYNSGYNKSEDYNFNSFDKVR